MGLLILCIPGFINVGLLLLVRALVARRFGYAGFMPLLVTERVEGGFLQRALACAAGFSAVYLIAAALSGAGAYLHPGYVETNAVDVRPDGAAWAAGLRDGDKIVTVDGKGVERFSEIAAAISETTKPIVEVRVQRGSDDLAFDVSPREIDGRPRIGVAVRMEKRSVGVLEAMGTGLTMPVRLLVTLFEWLMPRERANLGSVVAMTQEASRPADEGPGVVLTLLGVADAYTVPLCAVLAIVLAFAGWRDTGRPRISTSGAANAPPSGPRDAAP